ncbi:MAG TPA: ABC transporter ATP-binding protein, partial [Actinomycetes bacterium]|nr:ABC transporter ATP-binding protein [Actinomycetes bacterium]
TRLSGGQRVKAGLAAILLARFDVLLLDEPTNNLDFDGLARLERFLAGEDRPVVLVSHDRAFLSATTTRIAELDLHSRRLAEYGGGYDAYVEERRRRREQAYADYDEARAERARLEEAARQKREWAASRRGERRTDNDRALAGRRKERATAGATRAKAIERRLERLGDPEKPWEGWDLRLSLQAGRPSGEVVASLAGLETPTSGTVERSPPTLNVGYLAQEPDPTGDETTAAYLRRRTGLAVAESAMQAALSPGERSRAGLAVLVARGTNLLLLDEPTNHLDLDAIEELERALDGYDGTLVMVSHDRRLLANLHLDRRLEVVAGRVAEAPLPVAAPG